MGAVIDPPQSPAVDVAVDLSGRERAVAEQLLDHPQVGTTLQQMGGEGMAQPVGVRHDPAQRAGIEPAAADGDEERVLGADGELGPPLTQVVRQPVGGLLAERDDALLSALAANVQGLLVEVDVAEVERRRLRAAQSGRIDELDEGPVPKSQRTLAVEPGEHRVHLGRSRRVGKAVAPSRRERDVGYALRPEREAQQRPDRGELACQRGRGQPPRAAAAEMGRVVSEDAGVDVSERYLLRLQPVFERLQVEAVGPPRGLTERGRVEETLDLGAGVHVDVFVPGVASPARDVAAWSPCPRQRLPRVPAVSASWAGKITAGTGSLAGSLPRTITSTRVASTATNGVARGT